MENGWIQDDDRKQSQDAGFDVHLTKPADPMELQKLISTEHAIE